MNIKNLENWERDRPVSLIVNSKNNHGEYQKNRGREKLSRYILCISGIKKEAKLNEKGIQYI